MPERTYSVAVVATMSAGKSTLLNAMIGRSLLPTSCLACTSSIFSIVDVDGASDFEVRSNARGRAKWIHADKDTLAAMNSSARSTIELRGDLPGIANLRRENVRVRFIDTPGPNNSEDIAHGTLLYKALSGFDYSAIVFVLNAASLHNTEELEALRQVKKFVDRRKGTVEVVFALNRMDAFFCGGECNKSLSDVVVGTRKFLLEKVGFDNASVIPSWAILSLRCRQLLNDMAYASTLDEDDEDDLIFAIRKLHSHQGEIEKAGKSFSGHIRLGKSRLGKAASRITLPNSCKSISCDELIFADSLSGIPALEKWIEGKMKHHFSSTGYIKKSAKPKRR